MMANQKDSISEMKAVEAARAEGVSIDKSVLFTLLPHLQAEVDRMNKSVIDRACRYIKDDALEGELAQQLWYEINANRSFARRLGVRATVKTE